MRYLLTLLLTVLLLNACKKDASETSDQAVEPQPTVAEKIAMAHGIQNWDKVNQIQFTFNVTSRGNERSRSWIWNPGSDVVSTISKGDTITYSRSLIDSTTLSTDRKFINDKFWLLIPFQMVWDEGLTISEPVKEKSPIQDKELNKIVLTYSDEGGYTPGDAYDIYYTDAFLIEEWIFRKGNSKKPSLICSFESYKDISGLKFATEHKKPDSDWNLFFTDIRVTLEE
ncbi:MAG: hypothetical protein KJO25_07425 [Bacteroidia bacterium]|nr:hypothetical protein [Bacteroidia bacterium]